MRSPRHRRFPSRNELDAQNKSQKITFAEQDITNKKPKKMKIYALANPCKKGRTIYVLSVLLFCFMLDGAQRWTALEQDRILAYYGNMSPRSYQIYTVFPWLVPLGAFVLGIFREWFPSEKLLTCIGFMVILGTAMLVTALFIKVYSLFVVAGGAWISTGGLG